MTAVNHTPHPYPFCHTHPMQIDCSADNRCARRLAGTAGRRPGQRLRQSGHRQSAGAVAATADQRFDDHVHGQRPAGQLGGQPVAVG